MAVVLHMMGGLGNQMFQIAAVYAYTQRYNKRLYIPRFATASSITPRSTHWHTVYQRLKDASEDADISTAAKHNDGSSVFHEIPLYTEDVTVTGYFQSIKYFQDYIPQIRALFAFDVPLAIQQLQPKDITCAIHVRRGDYIHLQAYHTLLSLNYYTNAINIIQTSTGTTSWMIFSDDIAWVEAQPLFKQLPHVAFMAHTDHADLWLMSRCHHYILANSTFSWWGCFLNQQETTAVVVAPKQWYGPYGPQEHELYLPGWILL